MGYMHPGGHMAPTYPLCRNSSGRESELAFQPKSPVHNRPYIGGSDARIIMGHDEPALLRLWGEKRGEIERQDLSGNLIVQLGVATEPLNRHWFERNTGHTLKDVQRQIRHPVLRWMGATLDGVVAETD